MTDKRIKKIGDIKESINDTRKGFEESFATGDFYNPYRSLARKQTKHKTIGR